MAAGAFIRSMPVNRSPTVTRKFYCLAAFTVIMALPIKSKRVICAEDDDAALHR